MPTLRFDWHGTGDSAGSDTDPARMLAWLESLRAAIHRFRLETGVTEISLVGLRLGATLAALVAEEMHDIEGVALLAPVLSGKSYVRELRALSAFGSAPRESTDGSLEAAGFVLTADTLRELRGLDLEDALRRRPAGRVLLMHRPDAPTDPRLAQRLVQMGASVEQGDIEGYGDFVCDSEWSTAPRAVFDRLVAWLKQGARQRSPQLAMPMSVRLRLPGATEEPVMLAGRAALVATSCTPALADTTRPAILFLNTGWYARMGANRMAVTLARHYARQGFTSLRVDLAGVGDSEPAPEGDSPVYNLKSCADVTAAIDWLEARGHKQVVLFGMCSGAYLGFQASQRDPRVIGQVLVNAQRFEWTGKDSIEMAGRTTGRSARQLVGEGLRAAFQSGKLGRLLAGDPKAWRMARAVGERAMQALRNKLGPNSDTRVARELRSVLQRGVKTMLVFSAGDAGLAECAQQFGEGLELIGRHDKLAFEIIEGASHTLSELQSRQRLTALMDGFLAPWAPAQAPRAKAA